MMDGSDPPADFTGRTAVVTGGTDGMGAATALALRRRGADVVIIGRSHAKADSMVAAAASLPGPGSLRAVVADFSLMSAVRATVEQLAQLLPRIDVLVHAVGILITRTEHTPEGIEKDFAVSYLARFVFLETAHEARLLGSSTRMINIAASSPSVPSYARLDVTDLDVVKSRTGMRSHGQAQLANDLLTAQAGDRYGITAIGYGPGSVDTGIRREIPAVVRAAMKPFFAWSTRKPAEVAEQLVAILSDPQLTSGRSYFFGRSGQFPVAEFVADPGRQQGLLDVSLALALTPPVA